MVQCTRKSRAQLTLENIDAFSSWDNLSAAAVEYVVFLNLFTERNPAYSLTENISSAFCKSKGEMDLISRLNSSFLLMYCISCSRSMVRRQPLSSGGVTIRLSNRINRAPSTVNRHQVVLENICVAIRVIEGICRILKRYALNNITYRFNGYSGFGILISKNGNF